MTNKQRLKNLFEKLTSNTCILTPNRRLSATLHKLYQKYQLEQKKNIWTTPDILPMASWIHRTWMEYAQKTLEERERIPLLLNTTQEQFLWEKIILNSKNSNQLLQVTETADTVKSAWNLLNQWQVSLANPLFKCAEDYHALLHWATEFETVCRQYNYLDTAALPSLVAAKIKTQTVTVPKNIVLIGFTEISPQLQQLLSHCENATCEVTQLEFSQHAATACQRIALTDLEQEILTMARWSKNLLEENPEANIGCVVPSLEKIRDRVMQIFSEVFSAENSNTTSSDACAFNISAGKNLLQFPIIKTAFQLLGMHRKIISREILAFLLASPYLGEAEAEYIKRADFDRYLRKENITAIDLTSERLAKSCPKLAKRIGEFLSLIDEDQKKHSYNEWAIIFNKLLNALGWPGERSLNSDEYQVVESWLDLLAEYSTLDQIAKPVTLQHALPALQKMAAQTIFQPKTPAAPIQILGVLEAAASPFDYLWVAGMDDISWPPQPKPNPFIPKKLQRELQMPHATAERELLFCNTLIQQFKQSANYVIFSHAKKIEDLELQPSPLIRDLPETRLEELDLSPWQSPSERIYMTKNIETFADETAPKVHDEEKIRGGVSVIRAQALCPFRAFAEWRLHARELEKTLPGLRAKERGTILHKILEIIWSKLCDQQRLVNMDDVELSNLVTESISETLTTRPNAHGIHSNYISLEKQRLHELVWEWLQLEKMRPPFKVLMSEKVTDYKVNQLNLSFRIDRVDELTDGKKLIIDYKTSINNDINNWFDERPEEPQLPLYALLDPENTIGISFAQIAPGQHCFKGVSHYPLEIKGIKVFSEVQKITAMTWNEQLAHWSSAITQLSNNFIQGDAKVDPKKFPQTCNWCAIKPICRIDEEVVPA